MRRTWTCYFFCLNFLLVWEIVVYGNSPFNSELENVHQAYQAKEQQTNQFNHSQQLIGPTDKRNYFSDNECPQNCTCKPRGRYMITNLDCSARNLWTIPSVLPSSMLSATFEGNNISAINCQVFKYSKSLQTLNLAQNRIDKIEPCAFQTLSGSLEHVDISHNNLQRALEVNIFKGFNSLQYLNLSATCIEDVKGEIFHDLLNLQVLDLSYNQLKTLSENIFIWLHSLTHLYLQENILTWPSCLRDTIFQTPVIPNTGPFPNLSKLQVLDLSGNRFFCLPADTFVGLVSLTHLYLQKNYYYSTDISVDSFRGLQALKVLNIKGNTYFTKGETYPDKALASLTNLEELYLDGIPNTVLGPRFQNLTKLNTLAFSYFLFPYVSTCEIGAPPLDYFRNIKSSVDFHLNLSYCSLTNLSKEVFEPIQNLYSLDLSGNPELGFDQFENWSASFSNSRLTHLNLTSISNRKIDIPARTFKHLNRTQLKTLILRANQILFIDGSLLPETLEYIDISENYFSADAFALSLPFFSTSKYLKVLKCNNMIMDSNAQTNPLHLKPSLQIESRKFTRHSQGGNSINSAHLSGLNLKCLRIPESLEILSLRNSYVVNWWYNFFCSQNYSIRFLDIANFLIYGKRVCLISMKGFNVLEYLDLSNNNCQDMDKSFFKNLSSLQTLFLQNISLGDILLWDQAGVLFSDLSRLRKLHLRNNFITDLSKDSFAKNVKLQGLDLSQNKLTNFAPSLAIIQTMVWLNLSGNFLTGFDEGNIKDFQRLKSVNDKFQIDLSGNRLLFTCDNIPFLKLVKMDPDLFTRGIYLQFQPLEGMPLGFNDMVDSLPFLEKQCLVEDIFIYVLILFFIVTGSTIVSAVLYHKRWRLRYLYYIGQRRNHIGGVAVTYRPEADLFVTYDQGEPKCLRFVRQIFLPILTRAGIRYIIGEVDFPGGNLMSHITGAITGTRKTLILLSNDIFLEPHREMEMNLAIMREIDTRDEILVPVFVEDVDLTLYPREITTFLQHQQHRWLMYEDSEDFWKNLLACIRRD